MKDPRRKVTIGTTPPQQVQGESSQDLPKEWKFVINHPQDQIIGSTWRKPNNEDSNDSSIKLDKDEKDESPQLPRHKTSTQLSRLSQRHAEVRVLTPPCSIPWKTINGWLLVVMISELIFSTLETDPFRISDDDAHDCMLREHHLSTPLWSLPFLSIQDVEIDLSRETKFEVPGTYDTYDDQSMGQMKFEKAPNGSWIRKAERAQPRGQGYSHPKIEDKAEIRRCRME
ncbi:hypothetical protein CK203_104434 [Vitis vinifera]|uniref:Uncharacterized protein n=1 Tax=Vitis vinifera TaxID=29760 RepID=A0A438DH21_VITVI|nr:hypothetical protein CK203_104434 [Vitis vinifera]